jgi:hypothetical protein
MSLNVASHLWAAKFLNDHRITVHKEISDVLPGRVELPLQAPEARVLSIELRERNGIIY